MSPEIATRVHVNDAVILARAGRLVAALQAIDASIRADPFLAAAHHNRGVVLAMIGRDREALAALDRAIRLDPADRAARRARCRAAAGAGTAPPRPVRAGLTR